MHPERPSRSRADPPSLPCAPALRDASSPPGCWPQPRSSLSCAPGCTGGRPLSTAGRAVSPLRAEMHRPPGTWPRQGNSLSHARGEIAQTRNTERSGASSSLPAHRDAPVRITIVDAEVRRLSPARGDAPVIDDLANNYPLVSPPTCRDAPMLRRRSSDRDDPSQTRWDAPDWEQAAILTEVSLHCAQWMPRDARRQLATPVSPRCAQGCAVLIGRECRSDDVFPICAGMLRSSPSCRPERATSLPCA